MPLMTSLPPRDTPLEHLASSVERVTFHSEETDYCVLRVTVRGHRDLVTMVSTFPPITPGEESEGDGWWITDHTYSVQCKIMHLRVVLPTMLEGIERYLEADTATGMGPHFARKLVQPSAPRSSTSSSKPPHRLQDLDGIGQKRMARVVAAWADSVNDDVAC
jgi:exodeoxyribonuclease V alpha subunit